MEKIEKQFMIAGKEVTVTTGNFGFRADTALKLQQGETVVMVFLTADSKDTNLDYFPLGINYMEKFYAGGIISGSKFIKRERRPSDEATIKGRIIDRGMRPLFPANFRRGVSIVVNIMAYDGENDPSMLAANAAAMAAHVSSVPFNGPVGFIRIGYSPEGEYILEPSKSEMETSRLDAVISATGDTITQLEVDGHEIPEDVMAEAFQKAFDAAQGWNDASEEMRKLIGKEKFEVPEKLVSEELVSALRSTYMDEIKDAMYDDESRNDRLDALYIKAAESHAQDADNEEDTVSEGDVVIAMKKLEKEIVRTGLLSGERPSGRTMDEIREIVIEDRYLPRVHGSVLFRRGISQVLAITTLASERLAQMTESFEGEHEKRYMHHYVGPNYSVGEAGRFSFYAGNREIGHGMLAEKALMPVLPSEEEFPYAIRVVSEILSQNGSSSMAATCGSCLALMDAGVPIKAPVAGISVGLITKDDSQSEYELLTDVQDVEDYYGDMDFKVTGTETGITAIQMDTKLQGVRVEILQDALGKARDGRMFILEKYKAILPEPRKELSPYAPKVETIIIEQDQIGELIGPGGKVIKGIIESVEGKADINIKDDGTVHITASDSAVMDEVVSQVKSITMKPEVGQMVTGTVARIAEFGAFVDISPTVTGLVHVSEISDGFVKDVSEHLKVGDKVVAKVIKVEDGKVGLSIKQASQNS
ncbi:polyribonucleotide nucleotidyltransferase [Candidatus Dojkabacteria bacterium]|uniref:Polyribonucleotide nucleotidyltransferase n=1 Tax=Candidatus Dojkabacteria bacterium TaxID=2099670 RepID=A0A955L7V5_9BACT|nr:polyribonucleotide nucleotidyltransferase [Candidatus Dojkabacteria bacterium]